MDYVKVLTILGLGLDIMGVIILFCIDFKMIGLDAGRIQMTESPEKVCKEKIKAYCALGCILLGFIFQMIGNIL